MKRLAVLCAASMLLYGAGSAQAENKFHIGGKVQSKGTVRVEVNGGAGRDPQFRIRGDDKFHFNRNRRDDGRIFDRVGDDKVIVDRIHNRRVEASNSFPVAVGPYGYGGGNCYFGMGGFSNLYNQGFIPVPPYFSLHPPVYYSVPVPRTYGYSPFPYPGSVPTPEVTLSDPEMIINPHVQPEEVPEPAQETSAKTARAPLVIRNPFVEQDATLTLTAQTGE